MTQRKRVFIGDVQGCADELEDLLERLDYDAQRLELWFVGDLINRGPGNVRVLRRVRELGADTVLGNHEIGLLRLAAGQRRARSRDTYQSVLASPDGDELLAWIRSRPLVKAWPDLVLVHAGLHPAWDDPEAVAAPLERQLREGDVPDSSELQFLIAARHCDAQGRLPSNGQPAAGFAPWDDFYRGERRVVCGHWSQRGLIRKRHVVALDTGCVWGGTLTAWIAEDDAIVQVPARRAYAQV